MRPPTIKEKEPPAGCLVRHMDTDHEQRLIDVVNRRSSAESRHIEASHWRYINPTRSSALPTDFKDS